MKKTLILLISLLLILGVYVLEGGALKALLVGSALVPVFLGPLLGAMFSFRISELADAFRDAFSEQADPSKLNHYHMDILLIKNISSAITFWSLTMVILGLIGILSNLTEISRLGSGIAAIFTALLLAFTLKALLFIPMETSIEKKIAILHQN